MGNRGTKLRISRNYDPIPRQYFSTSLTRDQAVIDFLTTSVPEPILSRCLPKTSLSGTKVARSQLLRPYPQFTGITADDNQGYSWYHSLQTRFEKRFSKGYTLNLSWTWSKFMEATSYLNETDPMPERGDLRPGPHAPLRRQRHLRTARSATARDWLATRHRHSRNAGHRRLAGRKPSTRVKADAPLAFGNVIFYGQSQRMISAVTRTSGTSTAGSTSAPDSRRIRTSSWSSNIRTFPPRFSGLRGDGHEQLGPSRYKNITFNERARMQFRAEFINLFNHTQFSTPDMGPTSSTFGQVTAASQWPRTVQLGLKLMW